MFCSSVRSGLSLFGAAIEAIGLGENKALCVSRAQPVPVEDPVTGPSSFLVSSVLISVAPATACNGWQS
jgi:hypothetical protein